MITRAQRVAIREALSGKHQFIQIGRASRRAGFTNATPIEVVEGSAAPELCGNPAIGVCFTAHQGRFYKNLYTPSTLHVVVGREWLKEIK